MKKLKVYTLTKTELKDIAMPSQFDEPIRPDLISRAVLAKQSHDRQPYGTDPKAGTYASAKVSRRRRDYRGSYGKGISRVPRKVMSRSGTQFSFVGAFAPGTVGGRRAHPPKATKIWALKINKKERKKAIRSALAATMVKELVEQRGHKAPQNYPFIIEDKIETITKTKDLIKSLSQLGFDKELERTQATKIRAGKGKMRGRKKITKTGLLIIISKECPLQKSITNVPGFEAKLVDKINVEDLAPGTHLGRMVLFTESAIAKMDSTKMFTDSYKTEKPVNKFKDIKQKQPKAKPKAKPQAKKDE